PAVAARSPGARSGRLYADQGERISGRAIVIPRGERQLLHVDANMLTAYAPLLSPYKPEYLNLILLPAGAVPPMLYGPYDSESRDYIARQQFAKGEVAHFALCGDAQVDVAIQAYKRAIDIGLSETLYQAEAVQPRRALTAYENYLALVELTPGERERIAKAKDRVQALRKSEK